MGRKEDYVYCNFCGSDNIFGETRDEKLICLECAKTNGFCEICGSIRTSESQTADEQLHYDEDCFK